VRTVGQMAQPMLGPSYVLIVFLSRMRPRGFTRANLCGMKGRLPVPESSFPFSHPFPDTGTGSRYSDQRKRTSGRCSLGQPGTSSFAPVTWGRSHSEAWAGCIVSLTTPSTSSPKEARSVSSRNLEPKEASVLAASYFLL
jgi:hypothetical protein